MPIRAVRSPSNAALWGTFTERFLSELGDCTGPAGYPAYAWLTHRAQRDALYREAAGRGLQGWLAPPVAFFSDFPRLFDLRLKPLTLLRRRLAIGGLAEKHGREQGFETDVRRDRRGIEHALDRFIGELLPEGIKAGRLRRALGAIGEDDFARRRNAWVAAVYEDYLDYLTSEVHFDPRAIHGFVSSRIADGHLPDALGDATRLHIYGLTTLRTRRRLVAALAKQEEVDVLLYLPEEEEQGAPHGSVGRGVDVPVRRLPDAPHHGARNALHTLKRFFRPMTIIRSVRR